jgi:hypothetical protein
MFLSVLNDNEFQPWTKRVFKRVFKSLSRGGRYKTHTELARNSESYKIAFELERSRLEKTKIIEEIAREEERRAREKRQMQLVQDWHRYGCTRDSTGNWHVPGELMWRSLPRGEDR